MKTKIILLAAMVLMFGCSKLPEKGLIEKKNYQAPFVQTLIIGKTQQVIYHSEHYDLLLIDDEENLRGWVEVDKQLYDSVRVGDYVTFQDLEEN